MIKKSSAIVLCAAALSPFAVQAQKRAEQHDLVYVTYAMGVVHADTLDPLKRDSSGLFKTDTSPMGLRIAAGRQWGPIWSTELSLTHYGTSTFEAPVANAHGWATASGVALWSVWRAPTDLGLVWATRLGVSHNWSRGVAREDGYADIDKHWGTWAPAYGLGLEYPLGEGWRVQLTGDLTNVRIGDDRPAVKFYALGVTKAF